MKNTYLNHPPGMHLSEGYSHAATGHGRLVAVSGQVPLDGAGALVGTGDPAAQADQVFSNLVGALSAAGAVPSDVLKLTFYLTSMADLPAATAARDRYLDPAARPASTVVEVKALFHPQVRIEVEAFAVVGR